MAAVGREEADVSISVASRDGEVRAMLGLHASTPPVGNQSFWQAPGAKVTRLRLLPYMYCSLHCSLLRE